MTRRNDKRYSKAWAISDRSGFKFPMCEMVEEDGFLVHKSEADGEYSLLKHPLSNMGRYLRGKTGDPFPVPNARPDINFAQDLSFSVSGRAGIQTDAQAWTIANFNGIGSAAMVTTAAAVGNKRYAGAGTAALTTTAAAIGLKPDWKASDWNSSDWFTGA